MGISMHIGPKYLNIFGSGLDMDIGAICISQYIDWYIYWHIIKIVHVLFTIYMGSNFFFFFFKFWLVDDGCKKFWLYNYISCLQNKFEFC